MNRLAIDFGSSETKIYMPGCGVVLVEATCVAVQEFTKDGEKQLSVKAYGNKARALAGRRRLLVGAAICFVTLLFIACWLSGSGSGSVGPFMPAAWFV